MYRIKRAAVLFLTALAVAYGCLLFCTLIGPVVMPGGSRDTGTLLSAVIYLCIVIVICTGLILSCLRAPAPEQPPEKSADTTSPWPEEMLWRGPRGPQDTSGPGGERPGQTAAQSGNLRWPR